MHVLIFILLVLAGLLPFKSVELQADGMIQISNPIGGQILKGVVLVEGSVQGPDLSTWDLQFAYQEDSTNTWFTIITSDQPVIEGQIAAWDTSQITDGDYRLRLVINGVDGTSQEVQITGLQVRNYSNVQGNVLPALPTIAPKDSNLTPSPLAVQASTLPPNPGEVSLEAMKKSAIIGAALVFIGFIAFGLYKTIRNERTRRS